MKITVTKADGTSESTTLYQGAHIPSEIAKIAKVKGLINPPVLITIHSDNGAFRLIYGVKKAFPMLMMVEKLFPPFTCRIIYEDGEFKRSVFFSNRAELDSGNFLALSDSEADPKLPSSITDITEVLQYADDINHYFYLSKGTQHA